MIERIKTIIAHYDLSIRAFAIKCGLKDNTLTNQLNGVRELSLATVNAILSTFEDISSEWLLRGKGTMLLSDVEHERNIIPDSNMERMNRCYIELKDISREIGNAEEEERLNRDTLYELLNEKDKTIKLLEEKVKRLETELAMIKNERKIG